MNNVLVKLAQSSPTMNANLKGAAIQQQHHTTDIK